MASQNDVEFLISLVENQPVLWDKTLDTYKDKKLRTSAWREICVLLKEDFDEMEQKKRQDYAKSIVKKWTNIRDCWMRSINEHKKSKKSGSSTARPREYIYNRQLSFLKKVATPAAIDDSAFNDNTSTPDDGGETETLPTPDILINQDATAQPNQQEPFQKKKKLMTRTQNLNELDNKMSEFLDRQMNCGPQNEDRNLLFFKSLLPSLATLRDEQILEFHTGVLHVLQSIKSRNEWSPAHSCTFYQSAIPQSQGVFTRQYYVQASPSQDHSNASDFPDLNETKHNI